MPQKKLYLFIYSIIHISKAEVVGKDEKEENTLILSMSSKEVMETVKTIVSSEYIRQLANDFAVRAAEHILNEIKIKESKKSEATKQAEPTTEKLELMLDEPKQTMIQKEEIYRPPDKITSNREILDDDEALLLLEAPFADGDNLDKMSVLSNEDTNDANAPIPVVSVMKINGVYYRRLLGVLRNKIVVRVPSS